MTTYLTIEERDDQDELVSYAKYDISIPSVTSLIPLPEPKTALQICHIIDVKTYYRRIDDGPRWMEPVAHFGQHNPPDLMETYVQRLRGFFGPDASEMPNEEQESD